MEFFITWFLLASVQAAATMSPGPAFAMTTRNAISGSRRDGILTAFGLGLGVGFYVIFVACGLAFVVEQSPLLYNIVKYSGAAYLIYIGAKAIMARKQIAEAYNTSCDEKITRKGALRRIQNGLFVNLLNPKALVFFTAVYAQFITPETPWLHVGIFCLTSLMIEFIWFSLVTIFLTNPSIRKIFIGISHWIERTCGAILIGLGLKIALSK